MIFQAGPLSGAGFGSWENAVKENAAQMQGRSTDLTFMNALMLSIRREWLGLVENFWGEGREEDGERSGHWLPA
jgi:hypothetical protein